MQRVTESPRDQKDEKKSRIGPHGYTNNRLVALAPAGSHRRVIHLTNACGSPPPFLRLAEC